MTATNPGFNPRTLGTGRPLLALSAFMGLFFLMSCGGSDSAPSTLQGDRSGERGAPCATFMDCVAELECVDGRCGIFGEAPKMNDAGVCPAEPEQGGGQQPNPGTGGPGGGTPTNGGGGGTVTTGVPTTTTTTGPGPGPGPGSSSSDSSSDTAATVPLGCEKLPKKYQLANPFKVTDAAVVAAGEALYDFPSTEEQSCAAGACHGPAGLGTSVENTALNTEKIRNTPGCVLLEAILEGVKKPRKGKMSRVMPGYKDEVSIEDAWKIVTYMRSL